MMTGEVIFGGVGSGLYGMLLFVLLAVFIAGLMVGRTPEYLGKKIEAREVKLVLIGTLTVPLLVLVATAVALATPYGAPSIYNPKPQGFSETLYAYTSQANNNGSAFAGYTGFVQPNAPGNVGSFGITFADLLGGLAMLFGRFVPLLAALAVAGSLAGKRISPPGPGTFRTDTPTFVVLLIGIVIIVAALTFFPALLLGPIVQGLDPRALLLMAKRPALIRGRHRRLHGAVRRRLPAGDDRRLPGPVPQQGRRQPGRARRQDGRLEPDRPGVPKPGRRSPRARTANKFHRVPDPRYFQSRPSVTGYSADVTYFNNLGPNNKDLADYFGRRRQGLPGSRGSLHPRADRAPTSPSTR